MALKFVKVLIIEGDEKDYIVTRHHLRNVKTCNYLIDWESDFDNALERVILQEHDIYLIDYNLGKSTGIKLVSQVINSGINVPFIFLTNMDDYLIDYKAMQVGATDYLIKNKITEDILERSIRYAIGRKQTEKALIEANTTKDKLFSIISHDLRSPMSSLLSSLDIIIESKDSIDSDTLSQLLRELQKTTKSAFDLLDNLLTWSRSQIGALRCKPERFELSPMVDRVVNQTSRNAKVKSIAINVDIDEDIEVCADTNMIHVVLRNLVSNALKFTHEMGKVEISAVENKGDVIFSIKDNGIGMDEATVNRIFDSKLFKSKRGTNNESGTGIGLKICNEFVTRNQGKIWVESKEGEGSIFYFTLPKN